MLRRLFDRLRLPFRKDRELRSALFRILGFYPQNIEYYKIAFAHKSQAFRDKSGKPVNNERLEFLGDAVLETVVSDILFHHFDKRHEGFLTATRSKIVQRESLNRLAKEMGIDKLIQTATRNTSHHSHLGGNAFEALMGAIYLDKGFKACQKFVKKQILGRLMDLDGVANKEVNFKSKLLEWCQKNKLKQDFVMHLDDGDKQKEPLFYCTVVIESIEFGFGKGYSKKEAQQLAARETLTMLRRDENVVDSVFRSKEKRTAMEANEMAVLPKIEEIEDALQREQQQPKRPQPAAPQKAERKAQEQKPNAAPQPKEKKEPQPKPEAPKKAKKPANEAPVNLASLAEAAIAEAEAAAPHLPTIVAPHSTAVVATEPPRKREIVPVTESAPQPAQEQPAAPAVETTAPVAAPTVAVEAPSTPVAAPTPSAEEIPATETPKKEKRPRHKVTRIAEYTQTEVKSEEEVESQRQRIQEEREEKRRNKRVKREADRAKNELEKLTQPQVATDTTEVFAEVELESTDAITTPTQEEKPAEALSNSAKRRLRRKRAAERAQQEAVTPAEEQPNAETAQPTEAPTEKPAERKKHQRGNSRKRRRQQAMESNDTPTPQVEAEA